MSITGSAKHFLARSPADRALAIRSRWRDAWATLLFRALGGLVNRAGSPFLVVYRPDFDYDHRRFAQYGPLYRDWKVGVASCNGGDVIRLYLLYLNVWQVLREGIRGDIVEVGVYKGNSARILHEISNGTNRRLFLFDTFAGFDESELTGVDASVQRSSFKDTSLDSVRAFVGRDRATFVAGLFPSSADGIELPEQVAVLHVDCDLYAPMKAALETFYPRMPPGALIALHDYGSGHWPGATKAIDEFFADKPESLVVMPDKSGTAVARKI